MPSFGKFKDAALQHCAKEPTKELKVLCFVNSISKYKSHNDEIDDSYEYCSMIVDEKTENFEFHLVECADQHKLNEKTHPIPEFYLFKYHDKNMFSAWLSSCLSFGRDNVNKCVGRLKSEYEFVFREYQLLQGLNKSNLEVLRFKDCLKKHNGFIFTRLKGCIS